MIFTDRNGNQTTIRGLGLTIEITGEAVNPRMLECKEYEIDLNDCQWTLVEMDLSGPLMYGVTGSRKTAIKLKQLVTVDEYQNSPDPEPVPLENRCCDLCRHYAPFDPEKTGHCMKFARTGVSAKYCCSQFEPLTLKKPGPVYKCKHCLFFNKNPFFDHGCPHGKCPPNKPICSAFKKAEFCSDCEYYSDQKCLNFETHVEPDDCYGCFKTKEKPFPGPRCEYCSHYRVIDKFSGKCKAHFNMTIKPLHRCSDFKYFMTAEPDPPDRCSDCEHEFKPRPPTPEPLRLCPFCGSSEIVVETTNRKMKTPGHRVFCAACGCRGPERLKRNRAIEIWNSRPGDDS